MDTRSINISSWRLDESIRWYPEWHKIYTCFHLKLLAEHFRQLWTNCSFNFVVCWVSHSRIWGKCIMANFTDRVRAGNRLRKVAISLPNGTSRYEPACALSVEDFPWNEHFGIDPTLPVEIATSLLERIVVLYIGQMGCPGMFTNLIGSHRIRRWTS